MESTNPGGWTPFSSQISPKETYVFDQALKDLVGVNYTPMAFTTQVVNGMNYRFFCNAKAVTPKSPNEGAIVEIYVPIKGEPELKTIKMVMN